MLEVDVYYFIQYSPYFDWMNRHILAKRGRICSIQEEESNFIIISKTFPQIHLAKGCILLHLIYSIKEFPEKILRFNNGRPLEIKKIGKLKLNKDPEGYGFFFGISDLVYEGGKHSEQFFLEYSRDLERSWTDIIQDFEYKVKKISLDNKNTKELIEKVRVL